MMTKEEQDKLIEEITRDIDYFKGISFTKLADKFQRDFDAIKELLGNNQQSIKS
jgi:hypothetical protein